MDFAPPPGVSVDEDSVRARSAAVHAALERLHLAIAEPVGENFRALLEEFCRTLPSPAEVPAVALVTESGPPASPRLWDVERALRLVQHLLNQVSFR
jgi:hypothetical protein